MSYKSLYDFIERKKQFQVYEGTLKAILNNLVIILRHKNKTKKDYADIAYQTPRIIRALVDYNQEYKMPLKLLVKCFKISLKIYKNYNSQK